MKKTIIFAIASLFTTALYSQTQVIVGDGTSSGTYAPIASWYDSSATESIYTGTETSHSGQVTKIAYQKASGNSTTAPQIKIYMKQTAQAAVGASNYSIGATAFAGYTLVYDGTIPNNTTSGWMEVTLQTPFNFSASQNLAVLVMGSTCFDSGRPQYRYTSAQGSKMSAGYDDGSIGCGGNNPWTPTSIMKPVWERPNIRLTFGTLSNETFSAANSVLFVENGLLKFNSGTEISEITVHDVLGKELYSLKNINTASAELNGLPATNQLLLVKVTDRNSRSITLKTIY